MGADQVGTIIRRSETFALCHDSGIFCPTSPGMSGCSPMSRCIQHRSFARFQRGRAVVLATGTARRTSGTCALLLHFRAGGRTLKTRVYHGGHNSSLPASSKARLRQFPAPMPAAMPEWVRRSRSPGFQPPHPTSPYPCAHSTLSTNWHLPAVYDALPD